ncbi:hypothetical protein BDZ91DRAFT_711266 [Kalaharituber pfeilii]|nr:hypothetical protein BDZ91DRAFT_711266 [Kalaharituber pfeilii]
MKQVCTRVQYVFSIGQSVLTLYFYFICYLLCSIFDYFNSFYFCVRIYTVWFLFYFFLLISFFGFLNSSLGQSSLPLWVVAS